MGLLFEYSVIVEGYGAIKELLRVCYGCKRFISDDKLTNR